MDAHRPYISFIVTCRNDDHGGSLLRRMQTFTNALLAQCRRFQLPSELIVVDWNPPTDRNPLMDALHWPEETSPCSVRFITVPQELHVRLRHATDLPLFQMIAKNVGIRRARGEYALCTNIDILLNDPLMQFLADRRLQKGKLYRIDRHDAETFVPVDGPVQEQLEYCRTHLLRVNAREGTFPLSSEGRRIPFPQDLVAPNQGIELGKGWYPVEQNTVGPFRWASDHVQMTLQPPHADQTILTLQIDPFSLSGECCFQVVDSNNNEVARGSFVGRKRLHLNLPVSTTEPKTFDLHLQNQVGPFPLDVRILTGQIIRVEWTSNFHRSQLVNNHLVEPWLEDEPKPIPAPIMPSSDKPFWKRLSATVLRKKAYRKPTPLSPSVPEITTSVSQTEVLQPPAFPGKEHVAPVWLHINACGDFTLMHMDHWQDIRGYPEFETYSFNIDALGCYMAYHAGATEEILPEPMRIYHIEHGAGSGWTPEGESKLLDRLARKGIRFLPYQEVLHWALQMRHMEGPIIFNKQNWGLGEVPLAETTIQKKSAKKAA